MADLHALRPAEMMACGNGLYKLSWPVSPPDKRKCKLMHHDDIVAKFPDFCNAIDESMDELKSASKCSLDAEALHMCAAWAYTKEKQWATSKLRAEHSEYFMCGIVAQKLEFAAKLKEEGPLWQTPDWHDSQILPQAVIHAILVTWFK